jgi:hypothetical protein
MIEGGHWRRHTKDLNRLAIPRCPVQEISCAFLGRNPSGKGENEPSLRNNNVIKRCFATPEAG